MKKILSTPLALASCVTLPALVAATAVGILPPPPCCGEIILASYVAGGLLAFLSRDYGRASPPCPPRSRAVTQPQPPAEPARPFPVVGWAHHTISA